MDGPARRIRADRDRHDEAGLAPPKLVCVRARDERRDGWIVELLSRQGTGLLPTALAGTAIRANRILLVQLARRGTELVVTSMLRAIAPEELAGLAPVVRASSGTPHVALTGRFKSFNNTTEFGFISRDNAPDIFLSAHALRRSGLKEYRFAPREPVHVLAMQGRQNLVAVWVGVDPQRLAERDAPASPDLARLRLLTRRSGG